MDVSLNNTTHGYGLNSTSYKNFPILLLSGGNYTARHWGRILDTNTNGWEKTAHFFLGLVEVIPVVGGAVALAERWAWKGLGQKNSESGQSTSNLFAQTAIAENRTPLTKLQDTMKSLKSTNLTPSQILVRNLTTNPNKYSFKQITDELFEDSSSLVPPPSKEVIIKIFEAFITHASDEWLLQFKQDIKTTLSERPELATPAVKDRLKLVNIRTITKHLDTISSKTSLTESDIALFNRIIEKTNPEVLLKLNTTILKVMERHPTLISDDILTRLKTIQGFLLEDPYV